MDIALKQRLVGASVLVALGVIFIPMMLDGPGAGDPTSRIPEPPDQRFESRRLPVDPARQSDAASADATPPEEPVSSVPEPRPVPVVTRPVPETNLDPVAEPPSSGQPVAREPGPESTASAMPTVASAPEASADGRWLLQLGSFGNAANAARLVERLQTLGMPGYQEKVSVGDQTLYRVRAGGWDSKDEAARAGEFIGSRIEDIDVSVREREGDSPAQAPQAGWMVQVGSFSDRDNALALRDRLRAAEFTALVEAISQDGAVSYRVRVGPEIDRAGAEDVQRRLREQMGLNGIVVTHP